MGNKIPNQGPYMLNEADDMPNRPQPSKELDKAVKDAFEAAVRLDEAHGGRHDNEHGIVEPSHNNNPRTPESVFTRTKGDSPSILRSRLDGTIHTDSGNDGRDGTVQYRGEHSPLTGNDSLTVITQVPGMEEFNRGYNKVEIDNPSIVRPTMAGTARQVANELDAQAAALDSQQQTPESTAA